MTDKQQPGKWQFLYADGQLIGPVEIRTTVYVYPYIELENLTGLHPSASRPSTTCLPPSKPSCLRPNDSNSEKAERPLATYSRFWKASG